MQSIENIERNERLKLDRSASKSLIQWTCHHVHPVIDEKSWQDLKTVLWIYCKPFSVDSLSKEGFFFIKWYKFYQKYIQTFSSPFKVTWYFSLKINLKFQISFPFKFTWYFSLEINLKFDLNSHVFWNHLNTRWFTVFLMVHNELKFVIQKF